MAVLRIFVRALYLIKMYKVLLVYCINITYIVNISECKKLKKVG